MSKSPLAQVKEQWKDKASLVAAVKSLATEDLWLPRINQDKGWDCVSNAQLLRAHAILTQVKSEHGSRAKLIDRIAETEKRKDAGYRTHLERFPTPRLLDILGSSSRRAKAAAPAPAKKAAPAAPAKAKKAAPEKADKAAPAKKAEEKKAEAPAAPAAEAAPAKAKKAAKPKAAKA